MKAVVHDRYGPPDVLRIEDVPKPVPAPDEILVRIRATGITRSDAHLRAGEAFVGRFQSGLLRPRRKILGHELAGEVEAAGAAVTEFEVGDRVFGALQYLALSTGAHAEYMCVPERFPLAHMPAGLSFEEAGAVCDGALLTLNALRPAGARGQADPRLRRVRLDGDGGSSAGEALRRRVTAVCNTKNVELVRSLGADEVIDYLQEDFTKNGETYDVIFDAVGKHSFRRCKRSLKPGGVYLPTDGLRNVALWLLHKRVGDKKVVFELPPRMRKQDVLFLKGLIEAGEYRAVVDRAYPLEDVIEAHRYVDTHQKVGNVVLTVR
jgi:NADPH:quinone reductase-like Zn-dependent oxidoreductase